MSSATERRKQPRRKSTLTQEELQLRSHDGLGARAPARLLDVSEWGLSIECELPLEVGSLVRISGSIYSGFQKKAVNNSRYRVCWSSPSGDARHRIGVTAEPAAASPEASAEGSGELPQYYEILQLSSKADAETVHRVFRILAQRYHPDNQETGSAQLFREVMEAYRVLSDPQQRAAYDAKHEAARQLRFRIFQGWQSSRGVEAERRKRQGILAALYSKRQADPRQPAFSVRDLEDMVACPREHLEFSLWYLKDSGYVMRTDNALYNITAKGVDLFETIELKSEASAAPLLGLPAPV